MNAEPAIELNELAGTRHGQAAILVRACLEQPDATARALKALGDAGTGDALAGAAIELSAAVSRFYSTQDTSGKDLATALADAATAISGNDKPEEAGELLALAMRLGADSEQATALAKNIGGQITSSMREAMNSGEDLAAERQADVLKSLVPTGAEAWLTSGRLKLKRGAVEEARADLEMAVDLSPQSQNTLLNFARAQAASGQYQAAVLTLFKLLRISDGSEGRYRPLATAELETVFLSLAQAGAEAQNKSDSERLHTSVSLMEEIADGVSGSMIEYVAGARNRVRAAVGYARAAQATGRGRQGMAACDAAIELDPDSAALWSSIGRLRLHYNEHTQAIGAFRQALDLDADKASTHDGLAEALFRDQQYDSALSEAESAVAAATGNRSIADRRDRIASAKSAANTAATEAGLRHVAILGLPNQGNARLACRIAEASGGAFVGETIWVAGQAGNDEASPKFSSCQRCRRPDCTVYDSGFRAALDPASARWYARIAEQSGRSLLVSSDNSSQMVRRLDPALGCDAVIAYRSPASSWAMLKEHYGRQRRDLPPLIQFLQGWYRTYSSALHEFPQTGGKIAVNLDEAEGNGSDLVERVLSSLGIDAVEGDFSEQHFFGVDVAEAMGDFSSVSEMLDDLPAAETSAILSFSDGDELYRRLQTL